MPDVYTIGVQIFAYDRYAELEDTLQGLCKVMHSSKYSYDVYVNVDGPKNNKAIKQQEKIRVLAEKYPFAKFDFKDVNNGLAKSILEGVDTISELYETFLILEDDIVLIKNFDTLLDYWFNADLFEKYAAISLYSPFSITWRNYLKNLQLIETFRFQCWGWVINRSNWREFRDNWCYKEYQHVSNQLYERDVGTDSLERLNQVMNGKRDLWACQFIAYFHQKKKSIIPSNGYVKNIGLLNGTNSFNKFSVLREFFNASMCRTSKGINTCTRKPTPNEHRFLIGKAKF